MKYGLSDIELNKLREFYARYEDIEEVILYGSRAKGNHKPFSDVDISLVGANLTRSRLNQIAFAIDDLFFKASASMLPRGTVTKPHPEQNKAIF